MVYGNISEQTSSKVEPELSVKQETDKTNANQKLKDLGLTDDEIKAIKGIS